MTNKIMALLALSAYLVFCAILIIWVPEPDLVIVVCLVGVMICYDFYKALFIDPKKNGK